MVERQSLKERLEEIMAEIGVTHQRFAGLIEKRKGRRVRQTIYGLLEGKSTRYTVLESIADTFSLIPVIFFQKDELITISNHPIEEDYEFYMNSSNNYLGETFRNYRRRQGIVLEQLSERVGAGTSYLSQIELGKRYHPSTDRIDQMSTALNLIPRYLFEPPTEINRLAREVAVAGLIGAINGVSQRLEEFPDEYDQYGTIKLLNLVGGIMSRGQGFKDAFEAAQDIEYRKRKSLEAASKYLKRTMKNES